MSKRQRTISAALVAAVSIGIIGSAVAQRGGIETTEQVLAKMNRLAPGYTFEPTLIPNLFLLKGNLDYPPVSATGDLAYSFNQGEKGARHGMNGPKLSGAEHRTLLKQWIPYFQISKLISKGGTGPVRMLMVSAPDCGYCVQAERALDGAKIRYAIIPSYLDAQNRSIVRNIYCSPNNAVAWTQVMQQRKLPPNRSCAAYDETHFRALRSIIYSATPAYMFPDGDVFTGGANPVRLNAKIKQMEQQGLQF